ncbi:MAG: hypothetical protein K6G75_04225 [Lachnospiraceae bacterium]|nr:hypothetical protein [Lachnospiraceae bacterium]
MKFLCVIEIMLMAGIVVTSAISGKFVSEKFKFLYATPFIVSLLMFIKYGFEMGYLGVYISSLIIVAGLFTDKEIIKRTLAAVCAVTIVFSIVFNSILPPQKINYEEDFEKAFKTLKEHYVLTDEKGIDWDDLYSRYEPLFKEIDETQDAKENYKVWNQFTKEFYDGHTAYMLKHQDDELNLMMECYGNDYGLSIARLSSGEFVAINVEGYANSYSIDSEEEDLTGFYRFKENYRSEDADENIDVLKNAGIKNGTIITKWNGRAIDDYYDDIKYYVSAYPVRENEEFFLPMYVAGIGANSEFGDFNEDEAVLTYLSDNGEEKELTLKSLGSYMPRLYDSLCKVNRGVNITNLSWENVNDDTMLLRIRQMSYDSASYAEPGMYTEMVDQLRKEVISLKENGYKNIVFDMRSNEGGDPFFVQSVAGLFAPEGEHVNMYISKINEETASFERDENGKYTKEDVLTYEGEDLWHDGKIILLVNAECVSAGDDMAYIMGEYPNVRVVGFTRTNSSCQAVSAVNLEIANLAFSAVPNIDENGNVVIDTLTDRVGRTPFDEKIPFDQAAITAIFDNGEDYPLQFVTKAFDKLF